MVQPSGPDLNKLVDTLSHYTPSKSRLRVENGELKVITKIQIIWDAIIHPFMPKYKDMHKEHNTMLDKVVKYLNDTLTDENLSSFDKDTLNKICIQLVKLQSRKGITINQQNTLNEIILRLGQKENNTSRSLWPDTNLNSRKLKDADTFSLEESIESFHIHTPPRQSTPISDPYSITKPDPNLEQLLEADGRSIRTEALTKLPRDQKSFYL